MNRRFRRAVITDEITQDFRRAVDIALEYGLDGIELRSAWDKNPHELSGNEVRDIRSIVDDNGLEVCCIAAPVFKCKLSIEEEYLQHVDILKRSVEVARILGAGVVRGFTFWDEGDFDRDLQTIAEKILGVESMLRGSDIILAIEYDPATYANTSEKLEKVLQRVASPNIRALWDPGNNLYVPGAEPPYPQGYERLRPYISHIHVKDLHQDRKTGEAHACRLGQGEVGFGKVFRRLAEDGYAGWLSLETHYRLRSTISDELLALPKGSAFSHGGEEASRESLESWNAILRDEGLL